MAKARKGSRRGGALRGGRSKIARSRGNGTVALHAKAGGIATFAKGGGGGYRGFKSKKQWRWAWATHQPWARKKSHTPSPPNPASGLTSHLRRARRS